LYTVSYISYLGQLWTNWEAIVEFSSIMSASVLGAVVVLALVAAVFLVRSWPGRAALSPEERVEMASTPMPPLQRRASWSLLIGAVTLGVITAILMSEGAAAYWENDKLRMTVVLIFIGGLAAYVSVLLVPILVGRREGGLDERDRAILGRAPNIQSGIMLVALAAWLTALPEMFHDEGAVPIVYLYLMFGSIVIATIIGQSLGILLGYWMENRHGQG
jgi:hypothetical protein